MLFILGWEKECSRKIPSSSGSLFTSPAGDGHGGIPRGEDQKVRHPQSGY